MKRGKNIKGKNAGGWERAQDGRPPTHPRDPLCVLRSVFHSRLSRTCYLRRLSCSTPSSTTLLFTIRLSHLPFIPAWGCVRPAHVQNSKPINFAFVSQQPIATLDIRRVSAFYGCTTLAYGLSSKNRKGQGEERVSENLLRNV